MSEEIKQKENLIYQQRSFFDKQSNGYLQNRLRKNADVCEIGIVLAGEGMLKVSEKAVPCKTGDAFVIGPNISHEYYSQEADRTLEVHRVWFEPEVWFAGPYANRRDAKYCYGVFQESPDVGWAILTQKEKEKVLQLCDEIDRELSERRAEWYEAVKADLLKLLITLGRCVGGSEKNISIGTPVEWNIVERTIEIVEENFKEHDLTLGSISEEMYVSKAYLSKLFNKITGEMFSDYLRKVRLDHACKLLMDMQIKIKDIPELCGMKDVVSFRRAFLNYKGMTPAEYRRKEGSGEENSNDIFELISECVQKGNMKQIHDLIEKSLCNGVDAGQLLDDGILRGIGKISERFKVNKVHVPEVLLAVRAMNAGMQLLKPHIIRQGHKPVGKVCIGTVQGDLHDIGKNLVKMMMESKGLEVIDLGTDVHPRIFIKTAIEQHCQIICCSALLTTTMGCIEEVVQEAKKAGIRDKVKIMIGGAPVDEDFCKKVGADVYTPDAIKAAETALLLCQNINIKENYVMTQKDKTIVRELAKRYMEIAHSEKQQKMVQRMKDNNDLKIVRPPVMIDEIPWYQMNIDDELTCLGSDEKIREAELELRKVLYRWKHFRCDVTVEPFYRVNMAYDSTGIGLKKQGAIRRTDDENPIVSQGLEDIMEDEEALEKLRIPEFTLRPDKDEERMNFLTDLLGDVMPVKLCGRQYLYHSPWDEISLLRGVEAIFFDLYDRPEYLHRIRQKFRDMTLAELDFVEKNMPVDPNGVNLHSTPAQISGLAADGLKATWFRGMSQPFSDVSPEMFEEFEMRYIKDIAERFAYSYYGCCEPLDRKLHIIKQISNLRKVGVSPWANEESSAEQLRGNYVYARKPNPAFVAIRTDPEVIRKETEKTVQICQKYGCPAEFVLKDISTVSKRPENLIVWAETVAQVLDQYYGE